MRLAVDMRIAVLGTGNIGGTLGAKWLEAGHEVVYGSRHPDGEGPGGAPTASFAEAAEGAAAVVLAVPGGAVEEVVGQIAGSLAGTIVVDATNRLGADEFNNRAAVVDAAPEALYVRAFNSLGWENFADPMEGTSLMYAADPGAVEATEGLIKDVGLEPVLLGDATAVAAVDSVGALWFALVRASPGSRRVALRVLR